MLPDVMSKEYREIWLRIGWHAAIGAVPIAIGWSLMATAEGGMAAAAAQLMFGVAFVITGATIVALPIARLLAEPAGSIFFPERYNERPLPNYSIHQAKRKQGKPREAISGFEKLLEEYPQEVNAYVEMIDIAVVDLQDRELAEKILRKGQATLEKAEDREGLQRMYRARTAKS